MGIIQWSPGASGSVGATNGGKVYTSNALDTTPVTIVPANPARQSITFHNPGTIDFFVAPLFKINSAGVQSALAPTTSALGGCWRVYGNGGEKTFTGECQGAWQAFSASGSGNPLTAMDSNV